MSLGVGHISGETLKGLYLKGFPSKHRSIACPPRHSRLQVTCLVASALANGICKCRRPVRLWTDFPRPRGWRVTTALGNQFPCRTALGNPFPCRKVCFAQKAPLDKPPLRLPESPQVLRSRRPAAAGLSGPSRPECPTGCLSAPGLRWDTHSNTPATREHSRGHSLKLRRAREPRCSLSAG